VGDVVSSIEESVAGYPLSVEDVPIVSKEAGSIFYGTKNPRR